MSTIISKVFEASKKASRVTKCEDPRMGDIYHCSTGWIVVFGEMTVMQHPSLPSQNAIMGAFLFHVVSQLPLSIRVADTRVAKRWCGGWLLAEVSWRACQQPNKWVFMFGPSQLWILKVIPLTFIVILIGSPSRSKHPMNPKSKQRKNRYTAGHHVNRHWLWAAPNKIRASTKTNWPSIYSYIIYSYRNGVPNSMVQM